MLSFMLAVLSLLKTAAYEGYPGNLLTKGKTEGAAIGIGGTVDLTGPSGNNIIQCEGDSTLTVQVDMTGAAIGDVTVQVNPVAADGATISGVNLVPFAAPANIASGGHVYFYAEYDVSGLGAVRVQAKNNNAGAQTITRASWRLS